MAELYLYSPIHLHGMVLNYAQGYSYLLRGKKVKLSL
jgi:hypothetical protein